MSIIIKSSQYMVNMAVLQWKPMAKIEIYETENDINKEAERRNLKAAWKRAGAMVDIGAFPGILFTSMGVFDVLFEKLGFNKWTRETKLVKFLDQHSPIPKPINQKLEGW